MIKKIVTVSVAAFFAFLISSIETSAQQQGQVLDQLRAQNFIVHNLQGRRVELNKLIGRGKPVVIDFWATWCGPCRHEIPDFNSVYSRYRDRGVEIIGISVDQSPEDEVPAFIKKIPIDYPVLLGSPDLMYRYGIRGLPTTFIVDRSGRVVNRIVGMTSASKL